MKLTIKQQRFADEYIISGNATEAYLKAYPSVKKETTARANSSRLLTNANIISYLQEREKEINDKAIAKQDEVLKILTSHARRETIEYDVTKDGDIIKTPTSVANSIKAAELLGKRYGTWTDKVDLNAELRTVIVDDIEED